MYNVVHYHKIKNSKCDVNFLTKSTVNGLLGSPGGHAPRKMTIALELEKSTLNLKADIRVKMKIPKCSVHQSVVVERVSAPLGIVFEDSLAV